MYVSYYTYSFHYLMYILHTVQMDRLLLIIISHIFIILYYLSYYLSFFPGQCDNHQKVNE